MAANFPHTALVTILMLMLYFWTSMRVGKARSVHGVKAPATEGPEAFNLVFRANVNTLEQLVLTLPAMWLFAAYGPKNGDIWAALVGVVWMVGRVLYVTSYSKAADKRGMGFMVGFIATAVALAGALVSIGWYIAKEM
jgi:glutathione S-transferase